MTKFTDKYGPVPVKALSFKQPYCDLLYYANKVETRTWNTKYRGWVLICTSKEPYTDNQIRMISGKNNYDRVKDEELFTYPLFGMAVYVGKLIDCRPMQPDDEDITLVKYVEPQTFTNTRNFKNGREVEYERVRQLFCHVYQDVQQIQPFVWAGYIGLMPLKEHVIDRIILL